MGRKVAATLHESADWKALADKLDDPTLASELQFLEAGSDKLTRARYMELVDADTRLRERVREVTDATGELGRVVQKIEAELDHLGSEAARWPQRAKLARGLDAPEAIQRRTEAAGADLDALRERLRARRDEVLVAFERGRRAAVAHRRAAREGRRAQGEDRRRAAQGRGHSALEGGPGGVSARRRCSPTCASRASRASSTSASTARGSPCSSSS